MKNVNLKVDPALWQAAKVEAVKRGQKLMEFVAEALTEKINSNGKGVSNAKG